MIEHALLHEGVLHVRLQVLALLVDQVLFAPAYVFQVVLLRIRTLVRLDLVLDLIEVDQHLQSHMSHHKEQLCVVQLSNLLSTHCHLFDNLLDESAATDGPVLELEWPEQHVQVGLRQTEPVQVVSAQVGEEHLLDAREELGG